MQKPKGADSIRASGGTAYLGDIIPEWWANHPRTPSEIKSKCWARSSRIRRRLPRNPHHRLHQFVDTPGRHAADPGLLYNGDRRLFGGLARLQKGWEV